MARANVLSGAEGALQSETATSARAPKGEEVRERVLVAVARLRQFIEDSDLSFYKIASCVGASGGILSMWLAGTVRPRAEELAAIEKFLQD